MQKLIICLLLVSSLPPLAEAQRNAIPADLAQQQKPAQPMLADTSFIVKATMGTRSEIELSKLALNKSKDGSILAFAQRTIDDLTAALSQIESIAKTKNLQVSLSLQPDEANEQKIKQLSTMSESEFNKAFRIQMQEDYNHAVALFSAAANDKNLDPQLKDMATNMLPTLRNHQHAAHDLGPH